ncbi:hypothetical protein BDM02DRAFT_3130510 [Thelephora ganbajun]|uniref:Uncharacterized protein n=1 Tax=Thelephora ganbajun TaxID=370292 RepID=A0ACB6ZA48_THEGA|nr:hypothetical protein BDM02DRAFT_3130510 [Thelephora ganbajun]
MSSVSYPAVPPQATYTSCYCEENIYLLAASFLAIPDFRNSWDLSVVFISNRTKTVALWNQRPARAEGVPIVWDYHVVLVLRPLFSSRDDMDDGKNSRTGSLIYDLDTTLDLPYDAQYYLKQTFPYIAEPSGLDAEYHRIIPGDVFITDFASDRSHMVVPISEISASSVPDDATEVQNLSTSVVYKAAPPLYPPIAGVRARENGIVNNLMTDFVDMSNPKGFGVVVNLEELMTWIVSQD